MDERQLNEAFNKIKEEIPVNEVLKKEMRKKFISRSGDTNGFRGRWSKGISIAGVVAAVACIMVLAVFLTPEKVIEKANAASLRIANQMSFVDIGGGSAIGVSEYQGRIYLPVLGDGLFAYDDKGFHKLLNKDVDWARVSPDGEKLAYTSHGTLGVYDLQSGRTEDILKGSDARMIYYQQPSWSPDGNRIIYTKEVLEEQEHGFLPKERAVYEVNLSTGKSTRLVEGNYASYVRDANAIVFERDNKILYKDLKNGSEKVVDDGRFPAVSPDGEYIAYVKTESSSREVAANATVRETMENVWIIDAVDFATKKRVTSNFINGHTDVDDWVKGIKPSQVPQELLFTGNYSYAEPVWSSSSASLFVIKNQNLTGETRLVRIDFTTEKMGAEDTVGKFIQALIIRDEDFAKSLMKSPPENLTISNPRRVGYRIVGSGQEKDKEYIDAEVYWEYTANPYYQVEKSRFFVSPGKNGYIIDSIKQMERVEIAARDDTGGVYLTKDDRQSLLFKEGDIPAKYVPQQDYRFGSLAYNEESNTLIFSIQAMQDKGKDSYVTLLSYDLTDKTFGLIDKIDRFNGNTGVGIQNLTVDDTGQFVAADLFADQGTYRAFTNVYDIKQNKKAELEKFFTGSDIESIHTTFWDERYLNFNIINHRQSMGYQYDPQQGEVHLPL